MAGRAPPFFLGLVFWGTLRKTGALGGDFFPPIILPGFLVFFPLGLTARRTREKAPAFPFLRFSPRVGDARASRRHRAAEQLTAPQPAVEAASAATPDDDQFVFVRRDGTVFFAVAYSWENGTLRYVTSQGLRHTVTQDALDLDATQQFNEQRGLNFRLPA